MTTEQAPSAKEIIERNTNPEFDTVERLRKRNNTIMSMLKQTITELRKAEVAYDNLCNSIGKAPSATVDEKYRIQCALKAIDDYREKYPDFDIHIVSEIRIILTNATAEELKYYAPLRSQQPTVDVEKIADKYAKEICEEYDNQAFPLGLVQCIVKKALQQTLQGRYTREEVVRFCWNYGDWSIIQDVEDALTQYDTERGKNGKV